MLFNCVNVAKKNSKYNFENVVNAVTVEKSATLIFVLFSVRRVAATIILFYKLERLKQTWLRCETAIILMSFRRCIRLWDKSSIGWWCVMRTYVFIQITYYTHMRQ